MKKAAQLIATFFGIGYCPLAPGTAASAVVVLLYRFFLHDLGWPIFLGIGVIVYAAGVWSSGTFARARGLEDPGIVVIDEVIGQLIALFMLPPTWTLLLAAFLLFRFFDILKPLLIRRAERFSGGWGIMLDDVVAGLYTGICLQIYLRLV